ncbi:response regulator transcription factor [Dyadobacter sp. CY261]|uniref:response regulator transcription factor n=1 Tax=Dyadobacter sp. CY261 TaxID=2907203 RepID=UPI001F1A9A41|nr:response regulator transcription factor [Dyadobacter sp. CY261]MCF0075072.1 response regulator transcription factor [Dyadobacter sp. CY261]
MAITVGIVEDNADLAAILAEKLSLSDDLDVMLQARNGKDLLEKLSTEALPDVLLMDIEMDEMDGVKATREVKRMYPGIRIIMQTVFDDDQRLFEAITAGASGYLLKDEKPARLINAITEVLEGGSPLSPTMATKALDMLRGKNDVNLLEVGSLTPREAEVLDCLQKGWRVKQIAEKLFISEKTVRKHLEHIYQKLQIHDSRQLILKR